MDSFVTNRSPCFHHARQVSRMIYMQMGQKNRVNFIEGETKFTETGKGARTDIHKKPRLPIDNDSVATGSATVCAWSTSSEKKDFHSARIRKGGVG
jgi:hypothetical protein